MSKAIAELREEGRLEQMEKKWFSSQSSLLSQETDSPSPSKPDPLGMDSFFGLFLISGVSEAAAILIFFTFLLGEKLSMYYDILIVMARGKLMSILRYLYPRMVNIIDAR